MTHPRWHEIVRIPTSKPPGGDPWRGTVWGVRGACPRPERVMNSPELLTCTSCSLCETRTRVVPGRKVGGGEGPPLVLVGEAPGENEDYAGKPFVGRSGKALDALTKGLRSSLWLTNVVKCRPVEGGKNRAPKPREVEACSKWLDEELAAVRPRVVVVLGKVPAQRMGLLDGSANAKHPAGAYTVSSQSQGSRIVVATYHPAYALRAGGVGSEVGKRIASDLHWADQMNIKLHKEYQP